MAQRSSPAHLQAHEADAIVTPGGTRTGALLVRDGRILGVCDTAEIPAGAERIDHGRAAILPGLVDTHTHLNEPGRTEWEGFRTGTRAAAAGGYTVLVDMPLNALPATVNVASLEAKRQAADFEGQCLVDWAAWGGCVTGNQRELEPLARAGVRGFKAFLIYPGCEGFTEVDLAELEAALPHIVRTGLPLLVHAEREAPIAAAGAALREADWRRYGTYLASRPDEAELAAIRVLIALCRRYRFPLHIVHLASALALPELAAARTEGLPLTVETCPHYLCFAAETIPDGSTVHKCAPPIRSAANRDLLWQGLRDGVIDLVATDHSPCPPAMKREDTGRFDQAWGGIASLSVALAAMHTEALRRDFTLDDVARLMSAAPARLAGLDRTHGALETGREANFAVFDPERRWMVAAADLHFRHAISPYVGHALTGRVLSTWLRGEPVYALHPSPAFAVHTSGHELRYAGLDACP